MKSYSMILRLGPGAEIEIEGQFAEDQIPNYHLKGFYNAHLFGSGKDHFSGVCELRFTRKL